MYIFFEEGRVVVKDVLYRRTFCIGGLFVEGRFVEGRYVEGHFVGRMFCSEGRFVEGRFVVVPFDHSLSPSEASKQRITFSDIIIFYETFPACTVLKLSCQGI
jgi:hypothetical protein